MHVKAHSCTCNAHLIFRKLVRPHLGGEEDLEGFCEALEGRKVHGGVAALQKSIRHPFCAVSSFLSLLSRIKMNCFSQSHLIEGVKVDASLRQEGHRARLSELACHVQGRLPLLQKRQAE